MKEYLRGALLSETSLKVTASLIIGGVATVAAAPLLAPFAATAMATASIPIVGAASSAVTGFLFLSTTALCTCAGYGMIVMPLFAGGKALYGLLNTTFNKINQLFEVVKKITNFLGLDAEDEKVKELETNIKNAQGELAQVQEGLEILAKEHEILIQNNGCEEVISQISQESKNISAIAKLNERDHKECKEDQDLLGKNGLKLS